MMRSRQEPETMRTSWLIQRLQKPRHKDNPFAFGGGLRNGGLSDEAWGLLQGIFSFDYMGSAEFEFGALPKVLQAFAKDGESLVASTLYVPLAMVPANWKDKSKKPPTGETEVYVLCRKEQREEVEGRILGLAAGQEDLKQPSNFTNTLRPYNEWDGHTQGWLELSNGFFFFTDKEMFEQTASLFGVKTQKEVGAT